MKTVSKPKTIEVSYSIAALKGILAEPFCKERKAMIFLAEKDEAHWQSSHSSRHMNLLWDEFVYLPMNVAKGDMETLAKVYDLADEHTNIVGFNHTYPHKSNEVMKKKFGGEADVVIKEENGKFVTRDCNGVGAVKMICGLAGEEPDWSNYEAVIVGVGGSGSLIAWEVAKNGLRKMQLVDPNRKDDFLNDIRRHTGIDAVWVKDATFLPQLIPPLLFINSTTHTGSGTNAFSLIKRYDSPDNICIDLQMSPVPKEYRKLLTKTGFGEEYVLYTNYELAKLIQSACSFTQMSFKEFCHASR